MAVETEKAKIYRDPFAVEPLPRAYYHPTQEKKLSKTERSIAISPERRPATKETVRKSQPDELFLQGSHTYATKIPGGHDETSSSKFDESWPSSERPSSLSFSGLEDGSPANAARFHATVDRFLDLKQTLTFQEAEKDSQIPICGKGRKETGPSLRLGANKPDKGRSTVDKEREEKRSRDKRKEMIATEGEGSVLQKYIERFRKGKPMSREERMRANESASKPKDFWWLSGSPPAPSDSSTPIQGETTMGKKTRRVTPPDTDDDLKQRPKRTAVSQRFPTFAKYGVPASPGEERTRQLQERAERLLERSSSSVGSSEPIVSTEGLGSDVSSFDDHSISRQSEEIPYRPKFVTQRDQDFRSKHQFDPPVQRGLQESDEDILQKWRLRRKMEMAKDTAPQTRNKFGFLDKTEKERKVDEKLEEFKRQLSGRPHQEPRDMGHAHVNLHFTAAPQMKSENQHREEGQQSPYYTQQPRPETPVQSDPLHYAPSATHQFRPSESQSVPPPIASPVLQRSKHLTDRDEQPHLHLMCDLLPCPHQDEFRKKYSRLKLSTHSDFHGHEYDVDGQGQKVRGHDERFDLDRQGERVKGQGHETQYKQYLEAEKPHVESVSEDEQSDRKKDKTESNVRRQEERKKKQFPNDSEINDVCDKCSSRPEKKVTYERAKDSKVKDDRDFKGESSDSEEGTDNRGRSRRKVKVDKPYVRTSEEKELISDRHERRKVRGERSQEEEREIDKGEKKIPRPRHSSSPTVERRQPYGVEDTVGQVVKDRLFNMSTSTVMSSIESLPPGAGTHPTKVDNQQQGRKDRQEETIHEDDEPYMSDGEFADDHLLLLLRQQRSQYEQQLQRIDDLLMELTDR